MNYKADLGFELIHNDEIDTQIAGFHWRSHGRGANIYFVDCQAVVIIFAEMSATKEYDVLVFGETQHITKRYYPLEHRYEIIPLDERLRIQGLLVEWLESKGMRHDIKIGK